MTRRRFLMGKEKPLIELDPDLSYLSNSYFMHLYIRGRDGESDGDNVNVGFYTLGSSNREYFSDDSGSLIKVIKDVNGAFWIQWDALAFECEYEIAFYKKGSTLSLVPGIFLVDGTSVMSQGTVYLYDQITRDGEEQIFNRLSTSSLPLEGGGRNYKSPVILYSINPINSVYHGKA